MTIQIDGKMTVRDLVGRYPQTRSVFEKHGIDYCCGGGRCLAEAAQEHGLKLPALVDALDKALQAAADKAEAADKDWYAASLGELVDHIVQAHHGYMKTALPRLRSLAPMVLKAHGAQHGDVLRQVLELFATLDAELSSHLMKEEQVLFPYIVALERHVREGTPKPQAPFGSDAIRFGKWNMSTKVPGEPWQSSAKSPATMRCPRTLARPFGQCTRNCNAWRRTCTNISTWRTISCFLGQSNWKGIPAETDRKGRD